MKHFTKFWLLLFAIVVCLNVNATKVPASNSLIEYTGRIDFSNPDAPRFSYSGVSVRACFKGTGVRVILDDEKWENYYTVILDKTQVNRIKPIKGKQQYLVATGIEDKIHEVEIFRNTEEMFGKTSFLGFDLEKDGSLVEIADKRTRMIEFIGNSITCGYGNEGLLGGVFGASTENHFMTYAAITSRSFNARHLAVCRSGIGIYRNYDGPVTGSKDCMPDNYTRIYLYDEQPKYNFREKPDLICIDLGTNDFSTVGGDSARYVGSYLKFIDSIQHCYKNPEIICLLGSMMSGATLNKVRRYLQFIASYASSWNHGKVHFFEMSEHKGDLGIGIDYHPTVAQHIKNAKELTAYISKLKGWEPTKPLLTMGNW